MTSSPRCLVLGATGFVGSAVVAELRGRGLSVVPVAAPRLVSSSATAGEVVAEARASGAAAALAAVFAGVDVVVNAAGLATPGDGESPALTGANVLLPAVAALAARQAGVTRLVHLSSASVQGHRRVIDESSERAPFSAYSRSKAMGEEVLEMLGGDAPAPATSIVTVRATSVQGPSRPTTLSLVKVARSPLATVASPGTAPTPVSSINALAWFVVEAAIHPSAVPPLVLQPWEGLTVTDVLSAAGGRKPLALPRWLCHAVLKGGYFLSGLMGERLHGPIRRVELMWFGQEQSAGWAHTAGLVPEAAVRSVLEAARNREPASVPHGK